MRRNEGRVVKIYEDLSNDDLIDLLIKKGFRPNRRAGSDSCDGVLESLAPDAEVKQDADMGERAVAWAALQASKPLEIKPYQPLDSVWYGEDDAELIEQLLAFYPHTEPRLILDSTLNGRRFWRGSSRPVVGIDIEKRHRPDVCADHTIMPFHSGAFDVVVYDPPHIPNQGSDRSKDFNTGFGLGARSAKENGYSFAHTYPAFMAEAWRVLVDDGILLCKITDYIHNHRYQWAHVDLIRAGEDVGFTACDCIIKVRKGPIIDPKWKVAHHSRRRHCYWIVFRKSNRCE
jgi:hypothetical protein